ncbi:MAG: hypothetical protein HF967_05920 [Methanosarcinales archaeon]|jgi:Kef-type K+ transport system membrane component KefB|nr:hypothetical protein [Methanosarcinales archaeon]
MKCSIEKNETAKKYNIQMNFMIVFTIFLFGMGVGSLLAHSFPSDNWVVWGWALIITALVFTYHTFKKPGCCH